MPTVVSWSNAEWRKNLTQRLEAARKYRELFEPKWRENSSVVNTANSISDGQFNITFDSVIELESGEVDQGDSQLGMNYAFKFMRFVHSQLSANPPSVLARPTSTDPVDRRKADAADRIIRHGMRDKKMQEIFDQCSLNMLQTGTGWIKQVWDPDRGDVYDFNEETKEVDMEGDIHIYTPSTLDVWMDPDARRWDDVRYIIERIQLPVEQALFLFPEQAELIQKSINSPASNSMKDVLDMSPQATGQEDKIAIFEYYERGLPMNGMAGRHAWFLEDGTLLREPGKNPHYKHGLPYHCFTYIDVPGQVFGKSTIEYVARLQDMLNRLDSSILDNIQAHGVVRMAVPEGTQIEANAISNSAWDWIEYTGNQKPDFINPPALMNDIWQFRVQLVTAIQELFGINDSMLGIQRREQSAISQQTSIEAGTMIHRRVFKKYEMVVESVYRDYLGLVKDNWDDPRTILVLGKEKAFEALDLKGADIAGGFDIIVEYGASLPIDPNMRREAIMLLMQPLKEAGMSMRQILKLMKLNDLESMYDRMEMAGDRQREIFEEMIARNSEGLAAYVPPEDLQEHQGMLEYCYDYVMTSEFKYLEPDAKILIKQHIKEREQMAAQGAAAAQPAPTAAPAGMPGVQGAQNPMLGGGPDLATILGG